MGAKTGGLEGARVLLVEDDPLLRRSLELLLRAWGARVTSASSVRESLQQFERARPDVLVSDLLLPQEGGLDLIQAVRALPRSSGGRVPALAMSGTFDSDAERRALDAGFTCYLTKPVEPALLGAALVELLQPQAGAA
jgi:CheY-like chemotaxis protein